MQLKLQPFPLSFEVFFRLPAAQPHIPVLLPDAQVLSGRTYPATPRLNILRRDLNIQLIALLKNIYILDTVNGLDSARDGGKKGPCVRRAQRTNEWEKAY